MFEFSVIVYALFAMSVPCHRLCIICYECSLLLVMRYLLRVFTVVGYALFSLRVFPVISYVLFDRSVPCSMCCYEGSPFLCYASCYRLLLVFFFFLLGVFPALRRFPVLCYALFATNVPRYRLYVIC